VEDTPEPKLAVLLHGDVVGSTALVRLNETVAHQRIQDTFQRFSKTIATHGGIAHEIRGDALVAEFSKASDAVSASLAFQEANTTLTCSSPPQLGQRLKSIANIRFSRAIQLIGVLPTFDAHSSFALTLLATLGQSTMSARWRALGANTPW